MLLKPVNTKASFVYGIGKGKTRTVSLPMGVIVEVDVDTDKVAVRNFWSGAYEKWNADNEDVWIKLNPAQMQRLIENVNFKLLEGWKPCI